MSEQETAQEVMAQGGHNVSDKTADWLSKKLSEAMEMIENSTQKIQIADDSGEIKNYTPVAVRNNIFRKVFGIRGRIVTRRRESTDDKEVVMEAFIDFLMDGKYVRYANAFAGKTKFEAAASQTGKSMLQLAETAAIGRALANLGLSGGEFSSLEDLVDFNNEKVSTANMMATDKQIKAIEEGLKSKNVKLNEAFPLVEDIKKIDYKKANEMIAELKEMPEKKSTRRTSRKKQSSDNSQEKAPAKRQAASKSKSNKPNTEKDKSSDGDGQIF